MFSLICTWIIGWVNNREAVDLRRHRTHYDVIVMCWWCVKFLMMCSDVCNDVMLLSWRAVRLQFSHCNWTLIWMRTYLWMRFVTSLWPGKKHAETTQDSVADWQCIWIFENECCYEEHRFVWCILFRYILYDTSNSVVHQMMSYHNSWLLLTYQGFPAKLFGRIPSIFAVKSRLKLLICISCISSILNKS